MLTAVTGLNWGDEGKGRVIDLLAQQADVVVRYQGGNNAGHTVVTGEGTFVLNLLPSGILHPGVTCILGDGMVVDLDHLTREIQDIRDRGVSVTPDHLKLSARATISMPWHRIQDGLEEDRLAQRQIPEKDPPAGGPAAAGHRTGAHPAENHAGSQKPGAGGLLLPGAHVLPRPAGLVPGKGGSL